MTWPVSGRIWVVPYRFPVLESIIWKEVIFSLAHTSSAATYGHQINHWLLQTVFYNYVRVWGRCKTCVDPSWISSQAWRWGSHARVFHWAWSLFTNGGWTLSLIWCRWTEGYRGGADHRSGAGGLLHPIPSGIWHLGLTGHFYRRQ